MKYLVFGAGAIGSVFGGLLSRMGENVALIGRPPHINAIRKKGLFITGIWGDQQAFFSHSYTAVEELPIRQFDVIFITVKTYDTERAVNLSAPYLAPDGLMISLQNGLGNVEKISAVVGPQRTVGGRVIFGAEMERPGIVKVTVYADPVLLGSPRAQAPADKIQAVADIISKSGIPSSFTPEIEKYLWAKLLYNIALNPLSTILRVNYGTLLAREETQEIMRQVIREAFRVASAVKQELLWQRPEDYIDVLFHRLIQLTAAHFPSMLQDLREGRQTEIDALNGAIVDFARKNGLEAPVNQVLTCLIKTLETPVVTTPAAI